MRGHRYDIDAVVFDKDGTLIDFDALWCGWAAAVLGRVAEAAGEDPEGLGIDIGVVLRERTHVPDGPLAAGPMADVAVILAHGLYRVGWPWAAARAEIAAALREAEPLLGKRADVRAVPGSADLVERLAAHGVAGAVVTADTTSRTLAHLAAIGLAPHLPVVVGIDRVADGGKPGPEGVLTACAELGAEPSRTLMIGDSDSDMRAAAAAGLAAGIRVGGRPGATPEGVARATASGSHPGGRAREAAIHVILSCDEVEVAPDER